jgi:glucokinase
MDGKRYIGVDLGGTNIKCGVVTRDGEILHQQSVPTKADRPQDEIIADIIGVIQSVIKDSGTSMDDVVSIGLGSPGAIDSEKGEVIFAGNLYWVHVNLKKELEAAFNKPAFIANDANVAALAEALFGAGKG